MSLSTMTNAGEKEIPTRYRGGIQELSRRVQSLEDSITLLENKVSIKADKENYGTVKLSDATTVTEIEGLALPALEKNPGINDTLANRILKQKEITDKLPFGEKWIPYGKPESLDDVVKMTGENGICGFDVPSLFAPNEMMNMFSICYVHTFGAVKILELVGADSSVAKLAVGAHVNGNWYGWKMVI